MVQLIACGRADQRLVDNFCGSGTILAEALLAGYEVYGGDIDPKSVLITSANLANLTYKFANRIKTGDAIKTKWPTAHFDSAVSNLPWGKQVKMGNITELIADTLAEYRRILKPEGSICLLGIKPEIMVKQIKRFFPAHQVSTIKIGYLGQSPAIVWAVHPNSTLNSSLHVI